MKNQQEENTENTAIATRNSETPEAPQTENQDTHVINGQTYLKYNFTGTGNAVVELKPKNMSKITGFLSVDFDWRKVKSKPFIDAFSVSLVKSKNTKSKSKEVDREPDDMDTKFAKLVREIASEIKVAELPNGFMQEDLETISSETLEGFKWHILTKEQILKWSDSHLSETLVRYYNTLSVEPYFDEGVTYISSFLDEDKDKTLKFLCTVSTALDYDYAFLVECKMPSKDAVSAYRKNFRHESEKTEGDLFSLTNAIDFGYKLRFIKKYVQDVSPVLLDGESCDYADEDDRAKLRNYFLPIWWGDIASALVDYFDIEGK